MSSFLRNGDIAHMERTRDIQLPALWGYCSYGADERHPASCAMGILLIWSGRETSSFLRYGDIAHMERSRDIQLPALWGYCS